MYFFVRLRGGKLSGLSAATKTTCLLLAYEEDTTNNNTDDMDNDSEQADKSNDNV